MRITSVFPALAVLVTAVAGVALPAMTNCGAEVDIECGLANLANKRNFVGHSARSGHGLTNAQLLRRGLPLNPPVLRRGTPVRRTDPSAVPPSDDPEPDQPASDPTPDQPVTDLEPSQPASDPPTPPAPSKVTRRGIIEVLGADDKQSKGYISTNPTGYLSLGFDQGSALIVNYDTGLTGTGTDININIENWITGYPLLGLIQGTQNADSIFRHRASDWAFLGGIKNPGTSPNSVATKLPNTFTALINYERPVESSVWAVDLDGFMSPHWTNPDGSPSALDLFLQGTQLYAGSDLKDFNNLYGSAYRVVFQFVLLT